MKIFTVKCDFCGKRKKHLIHSGGLIPNTQQVTYLDACDDCAEMAVELLRRFVKDHKTRRGK